MMVAIGRKGTSMGFADSNCNPFEVNLFEQHLLNELSPIRIFPKYDEREYRNSHKIRCVSSLANHIFAAPSALAVDRIE